MTTDEQRTLGQIRQLLVYAHQSLARARDYSRRHSRRDTGCAAHYAIANALGLFDEWCATRTREATEKEAL